MLHIPSVRRSTPGILRCFALIQLFEVERGLTFPVFPIGVGQKNSDPCQFAQLLGRA